MMNCKTLFARFLIALLVVLKPWSGIAQKFERVTNYTEVNMQDTIEMAIHYYGDPDSLLVGSLKVDVRPFRIISGPLQSTNSASSLEGDVWKHSHRLSITYYILADTAGSFVLPPVLLQAKDGRQLSTSPLTLQVSDQPILKKQLKRPLVWDMTSHPLDIPDVFADGDFMMTRSGRIRQALSTTSAPFALITGWLHRPDSFSDDAALAMLAQVDDYVQSQDGAVLLSNELSAAGPRLYYTLQDTTGIRSTLDRIFSKAPDAARAAVVIMPPKQWNESTEIKYFMNPGSVWRVLHILLYDPSIGPYKPSDIRTVEVRCSFKDLQPMDAFVKRMSGMGYKPAGSSRKPDAKTGSYHVNITGTSRMELQALYDTIIKVSDELCLPEYKGALLDRVGIRLKGK